tara:strand:- start:1858 stop:3654 length:1797 start_codon:yes stop_codon:yes gene_type:complete
LIRRTLAEAAKFLPETITAPRTDPIYNCHSYLTKVPIAAIQPFIETFTKPGDTIADFFAGSGMTGLAALTLGRNARLSDISALGQHIAQGYLAQAPSIAVSQAVDQVVRDARAKMGDLYTTTRCTDGSKQELIRTVWSFTYVCPSCSEQLVFFEHVSRGRAPRACSACDSPFARRSWGRAEDVPVETVVIGEDGRQLTQRASELDKSHIRRAAEDPRLHLIPSLVIDKNREMYSRSGLGKSGMTETRKFFSPRNAIALLELWRAINDVDDGNVRQKLRFAFTAILPRASKRYQWSAQRPLNAQNQTYYIAPVYYEWNVFDLFKRKAKAVMKATEVLFPPGLAEALSETDIDYQIASADKLRHLKSESIDYVFTDPPFGSNIFYSDMNLFHEAWIGTITDASAEAVVHTTGPRKKDAEKRYEQLLRTSFGEALRVLKPGRCMSVVFGNSNGKIWGLVQRAIRDAGFNSTPMHVAILDKGQRSIKGLNSGSESVVTVDLVITVRKPEKGESKQGAHDLRAGDTAELISEAITELEAVHTTNPSQIYARILQKAINKGFVLDNLHLSDVLVALRSSGFSVDPKTGRLSRQWKDDRLRMATI